jgi:hypothetical protein
VLIAKVALFDPAATVTLTGTMATAALPLVRVTAAPPKGAAPFSVTVPVDDELPTSEVGFSETEEMVSGSTSSVPDCEVPLNPPVTDT